MDDQTGENTEREVQIASAHLEGEGKNSAPEHRYHLLGGEFVETGATKVYKLEDLKPFGITNNKEELLALEIAQDINELIDYGGIHEYEHSKLGTLYLIPKITLERIAESDDENLHLFASDVIVRRMNE